MDWSTPYERSYQFEVTELVLRFEVSLCTVGALESFHLY